MQIKKFIGVVIAGVLIVAFSGSIYASGKIHISPYMKTEFVLVSALSEGNASDFSVEIINNEGKVIFSNEKVIEEFPYSKLFDFSKLDDGTYNTVLKDNNGTIVEEIFSVLNGRLIKETARKNEENVKVKIWKEKDHLFVSYLTNMAKPYSIRIEDENDKVLYEKFVSEDYAYSGKFDLSRFPLETYYVTLFSETGERRYVVAE